MKQRGKILFLVLALAFILISLLNFSQAGTLKVTEEHPFLINGSWIPAHDLKVGDELTTIDGKKVRITSIQDVETKEPFPVYNLEAGKYSNFVVDGGDGVGVVVHNSQVPKYSGELVPPEVYSDGNIFEMPWNFGTRAGRRELVKIGPIPQSIRLKINEIWANTGGKISLTTPDDEVVNLVNSFNQQLNKELPFLGECDITTYFTRNPSSYVQDMNWNNYLGMSQKRIPKLGDLISTKNSDCSVQNLAIVKSLQEEASGLAIYRDLSPKGKLRVHTILAKRLGDKVIIFDPTEGPSSKFLIDKVVLDAETFIKKYIPANIKDPAGKLLVGRDITSQNFHLRSSYWWE